MANGKIVLNYTRLGVGVDASSPDVVLNVNTSSPAYKKLREAFYELMFEKRIVIIHQVERRSSKTYLVLHLI